MYTISIDHEASISKVEQITLAIRHDIEKGVLKYNARLPSISDLSKRHKVARETVEKAYNRLKEDGYITSVAGKGNYVCRSQSYSSLKILLIFNKLSAYKRQIYYSFIETLGKKAEVDLQLHHYDPAILQEHLFRSIGKYHYFVIMPHFFHGVKSKEYEPIIRSIPHDSLGLLDKEIPSVRDAFISVYQDFRQDIYEALFQLHDHLKKYHTLIVVFPKFSHHPIEILDGVKAFCKESNIKFKKISQASELKLVPGQAFITLTDSELSELIKKVRALEWQLGKDVGILAFNETILKELLDITVISSDFSCMGRTAAQLLLNRKGGKKRNPTRLIIRGSL